VSILMESFDGRPAGISLTMDDQGTPAFMQVARLPFVYLDHSRLMNLAEGYAERFATALERCNGTLALSWLNILELTNPSGSTFAFSNDLFLRLFPRVAFIEVLPDVVIEHENMVLAGKPAPGDPKLDGPLLKAFAAHSREGVNPMDPRGFLSAFREQREELKRTWLKASARIQTITKAAKASGSFPKEPGRMPSLPRPTRWVTWKATSHLIEEVNLDDLNNFPDFFHTVVPISNCDFTVLDKQWAEVARQIDGYLARKEVPRLPGTVFRHEEELVERLESVAS
jgi:hypothetical protein